MSGRHAAPRPARTRSLLLAAGAFALGTVVIIAAPGTMAYLSDATSAPTTQITSAAGITAQSSAVVNPVDIGTTRSVVPAPGTGLIPGVRGQDVSFKVTTGAGDAVQAYLSGTVTATASDLGISLNSRGALSFAATASAGCSIEKPVLTNGKIQVAIKTVPGTTLKPGDSCVFDVFVGIPATVGGSDLARELRPSRGNPVANFVMSATLTQVPRSEEK